MVTLEQYLSIAMVWAKDNPSFTLPSTEVTQADVPEEDEALWHNYKQAEGSRQPQSYYTSSYLPKVAQQQESLSGKIKEFVYGY